MYMLSANLIHGTSRGRDTGIIVPSILHVHVQCQLIYVKLITWRTICCTCECFIPFNLNFNIRVF